VTPAGGVVSACAGFSVGGGEPTDAGPLVPDAPVPPVAGGLAPAVGTAGSAVADAPGSVPALGPAGRAPAVVWPAAGGTLTGALPVVVTPTVVAGVDVGAGVTAAVWSGAVAGRLLMAGPGVAPGSVRTVDGSTPSGAMGVAAAGLGTGWVPAGLTG
jgi:hypothetical protein